jgi:hypothetical protein
MTFDPCDMAQAFGSNVTPRNVLTPGLGHSRTDRSLTIKIDPAASGRKWTAHLGDRVLCVTAWPFVKSGRLLLAEGHPADIVIEMWRPNTNEFALRGRLGVVAGTVIDGETGSRCAKNGSPARDLVQGGQRATAGSRSCSGHFWVGR